MAATTYPLRYAVRPRMVLKYLGQLSVLLAGFILVSVAVALYFREFSAAAWHGAAVVALGGGGYALARLPASGDLQLNEALVITCLIFLVGAVITSPAIMSAGVSPVDALFESISGVTTTGLSTLDTVENKPRSFIFTRAWKQWYGGLGMIVFSLALVSSSSLPAQRLATTEYFEKDLVAGARAFARRALAIYAVLTAVCVTGLFVLRVGILDSLAYAFAAVSTGGFAPHDASLNALASPVPQVFIMIMSFSGAVSFMYYIRLINQGWRAVDRAGEFVLLVLLGLGTSGLLVLCAVVVRDTPWTATLFDDVLTAFSAQTTTGFSTAPIEPLDNASKLVLIVSMAIGGEAGSTAGGFKVMRFLIFLRLIHTLMVRTALPRHAVQRATFSGRALDEVEISKALMVILAIGLLVLVSWFAFLAYGYEPMDALFEVVSATSTVGLSTGITGPDLPAFLKAVLCVDMLMGRLELFAWLVLLAPRTWLGRRLEAA